MATPNVERHDEPKERVLTVEPGAIASPRRHRDWFGRLLGVLVFLAGLGVLAFVFVTALKLFNQPLTSWLSPAQTKSPSLQGLADAGASVIIRILFLCLITVLGSIVTNRGIQMYFSAAGGDRK